MRDNYHLPVKIACLFLLAILSSFLLRSMASFKGIVKDAQTKQPVSGVVIKVAGSQQAIVSGPDGRFSIPSTGKSVTLTFSALGYQTLNVLVVDTVEIEVLLKHDPSLLQEVVVAGYAIEKEMKSLSSGDMRSELQGSTPGIAIRGMPRKRDRRIYDAVSPSGEFNTEEYAPGRENGFLGVKVNPLSTFSIDVDAASYSNVRRYIQHGQLPPPGAIRTEELINYFDYRYAGPAGDEPFAIHTSVVSCPWNPQHQLVSIGLQGKRIPVDHLPASNLVFLIDVSGSMQADNKLPLVKASLLLLADQLREQDKVAIVVYAGNAGMVLPATSGANKMKIKEALNALEAGGSTAGGEGIKLAYKIARENFSKEGNNRVILCTDGDFNVGASSDAAMESLIEKERESGVFLTVLGYGMGNYKDSKMEVLADKGNGNHAYIDGLSEAKKVLVHEFGGTLFTIARDVKLQIEFNPANIQAYRLIGYENRLLNKEDFNNDIKDAGDLGSGHTVTALYETIPTGVKDVFTDSVDGLKYQVIPSNATIAGNELMQVKFRYKAPGADTSRLVQRTINKTDIESWKGAPANIKFAAAVAEWGMILNHSGYLQQSSFDNILKLALASLEEDEQGYRKEFIKLVKQSKVLFAAKDVSIQKAVEE